MPMGFGIRSTMFLRRNRITSGVAMGTVIIEAALKSGAMNTANHANEQGREVMAVPGSPLDPRSAGTNYLIREGATLISSALDVAEALKRPLSGEAPKPVYEYQLSENINENEVARAVGKILNSLSTTPQPIDEKRLPP
jgi:DNA processing protein